MDTNVVVKLYPARTRLLVVVRISWPGSVLFRSKVLPPETPLADAYLEGVEFAARRARGRAMAQGWLG